MGRPYMGFVPQRAVLIVATLIFANHLCLYKLAKAKFSSDLLSLSCIATNLCLETKVGSVSCFVLL